MNHLRIVFTLILAVFLQSAVAAQDPLTYSDVKLQLTTIQVQTGVSFNDAVESLKLRANQRNLKFAGAHEIYKEIAALTGKPTKRVEIFDFCDGLTANKLLTADPRMVAFMPCRIAIIEDQSGKLWVVSMMMDLKMIQALPEETRKSAEAVMASMKDMMVAASSGDL